MREVSIMRVFPARVRRLSRRARIGPALLVAGVASAVPVVAFGGGASSWPSGGHDLADSWSNPAESTIGPRNAARLAVKWTFTTHGDVSATPAVVGGAVYFPDWGGFLNKVDAATGALIWSRPISDYDGVKGSVSRASPAVDGNRVYLGDQNRAHLFAVDAATGAKVWTTQLDRHPFAVLTSGPLVYHGVVYQGVSSLEETAAENPAYPCCTFRGSMVAVDAATGAIKWKTFTVPENGNRPGGYSGGAIWGTTPALDPRSNTLFTATGNNYAVPKAVKDCELAGGTAASCLSPADHIDSIMALNASSGAIKWATGVQGFDDWNLACLPGQPPNNCPINPGPDFDFGTGPNLFTIAGHDNRGNQGNQDGGRLVVGAGAKSGQYWALDAVTGHVLWSAAPGPGSVLGGILWGDATDGKRIYVAEGDWAGIPYKVASGQTVTSGSWAALDPATGKVLWQTVDPSHNLADGGGQDFGPLSVANGVVYAPSMSGHLRALDAATGTVLWDFTAAGSAIAGAAIVDGTVFWGDGYTQTGLPGWTGSTTFYAFSIPHRAR
jgi:polyvinyl alcohol dehydrogenase (cytochrome)